MKLVSGLKFNRWTLIERRKDITIRAWLCKCDCGNEKVVNNISSVTNSTSKSCGCYKTEQFKTSNPMFLDDVKAKVAKITKAAQTPENIAKRTLAAQSKEANVKRIATNIEKFGNANPSAK